MVRSNKKIYWKNSEPILLCSKSEEDNEWLVINGAWTLVMTSALQGYCKEHPEITCTFDKITNIPDDVTGDYNEILNKVRELTSD